jgi:hypothetical protein
VQEARCPTEDTQIVRGWFVPPIVVPVALLLLVATVAIYHT